jgi:thioredoxin 1
MSDALIQVTDAGFENDVVKADKPVVLDFWAPWCGPCRMMEPVLKELAEEYGDKIVVGKLNVDENPAPLTKYEILSIPDAPRLQGRRGREEARRRDAQEAARRRALTLDRLIVPCTRATAVQVALWQRAIDEER